MIWQLIATIVAGFGAAGIALLMIKLSGNRLPRYLTPLFAGAGMLSFLIYSEYQWFSHQQSLLPDHVKVVQTVEETTWWRPWSYFLPQTTRFMAADFSSISRNSENPAVLMIDIYLFAERSPAVAVKQLVHCGWQKRKDYNEQVSIPLHDEDADETWFSLPANNTLLQSCSYQAKLD